MGRRDFQSGSSLIELLVAVTVFAVVAIGLSPSLLSTRKFADLGKDQSIATTLALDQIERLRTLTNVASGGDTSGIFTRSWTVTANTPMARVNRLEMAVSWNERGRSNQVRLVTLLIP